MFFALLFLLLVALAVLWRRRTYRAQKRRQDPTLAMTATATATATFDAVCRASNLTLLVTMSSSSSDGNGATFTTALWGRLGLVSQDQDGFKRRIKIELNTGAALEPTASLEVSVTASDPRIMTSGKLVCPTLGLDTALNLAQVPMRLRLLADDAPLQLFTGSRWDQVAHLDLVLSGLPGNPVLGPVTASQVLELPDERGELRSVRALRASCPLLALAPGFLCILFSPVTGQVAVFATTFLIAPPDLDRLARDSLETKFDVGSSNGFLVRKGLLFGFEAHANPALVFEDVFLAGAEPSRFLALPDKPTELFAAGARQQLMLSCRPRRNTSSKKQV